MSKILNFQKDKKAKTEEPKVVAVKTYTITVTEYDDGRMTRSPKVDGFNAMEALVHLEIELEVVKGALLKFWGYIPTPETPKQ